MIEVSAETKEMTGGVGVPPVVKVEHLSKKFCRSLQRSLYYGVRDIGSELLSLSPDQDELRKGEFWALKDINFELGRGVGLGLVGRNGSGKTTLLRVLSGLIKPTGGAVTLRGRLAPMLALSAGFNPILSGRENVYVNMSILGLSKEQIDERFEQVVEFSEIAYALDAPLQTYSSGMVARLGFACAVHTHPDLLVIDEVLVVGDLQFQRKCQQKLWSLREAGTSFILVNHFPEMILALCDSAIYLAGGNVVSMGAPEEVIAKYQEDLHLGQQDEPSEFRAVPRDGSAGTQFSFQDVRWLDSHGAPSAELHAGSPAAVSFVFQIHSYLHYLNFHILIYRMADKVTGADAGDEISLAKPILTFAGHIDQTTLSLHPGTHEVKIEMPQLGLGAGSYYLKAEALGADGSLDLERVVRFSVRAGVKMNHCTFFQPRSWTLDGELLSGHFTAALSNSPVGSQ